MWNLSRSRVNVSKSSAVAALCSQCALCCNGVLFADVRLQAGDDAARLQSLGVKLREGRATARFNQPCSCLDGKLCRIYPDRPMRCRTFECRLLQRTQSGEVGEGTALKKIAKAHRCAEDVRRILRALGDTDEAVPLSRRYQRMMRRAIDLSADEKQIELRGELMLAVSRLVGILEQDFLG